jgi:hypothetical protein
MRSQIDVRTLLAGLALLGALLLPGPARAQAISPSALARLQALADRQQARQAVAPVVGELRQIRALLERADRDYKGHRAAAVKEIAAAIHALAPRHKGKGKKQPGGGEPQALSDAQLRQAIAQLGKVSSQLSGLPGKRPAKAVGHLGTAAKELEIALTIK